MLELASVTALVSSRIYTGIVEQSVTLPVILAQFGGARRDGHLRGRNSLRPSRVQLTATRATSAQCVAILDALEGGNDGTALAYWRGGIGSPATYVSLCEPVGRPREDYTASELKQFRLQQDFMVHHR